jgi:hypothetical protein
MIKHLVEFSKQQENFLVVAKDDCDKSYFITRTGEETADDFFWCKANRPLKLREVVTGYLHSDTYSHLNKMHQLIIQ